MWRLQPTSGAVIPSNWEKISITLTVSLQETARNCGKNINSGNSKKIKSRERKTFKSALNTISRQIVSFAESLGSGIKFEKLFSPRYSHRLGVEGACEFSFENGSFFALQQQVEKRAGVRGIPVIYVNPAYTSKRCSRCGCFGKRLRKHFECPHCGYIAHADVNAAFNIAAASLDNAAAECLVQREIPEPAGKNELRRQSHPNARTPQPAPVINSSFPPCANLPAVLENV